MIHISKSQCYTTDIRKEIIHRIEPAFNGDHSYNDIKQMYYTDTWDELGWKQFIRFNDLLDDNENRTGEKSSKNLLMPVQNTMFTQKSLR